MAEIQGVVLKKQGERCEIKVDREASENKNLPRYLDCWNPIGAKVGDIVGAEYRSLEDGKAKAILYGVPICGLFAGGAFGYAQAIFFGGNPVWYVLGGVAVFEFVSLSYARMFKRDAMRQGIQPVTYEIHVEETVVDLNKK